ncbi:MAG: hypothetical protein DRP63_04745 [Planctomycetota bacterium]|nr:MAG: hypothetical protein DRP63_04745 [Planctomycetota bacterium]
MDRYLVALALVGAAFGVWFLTDVKVTWDDGVLNCPQGVTIRLSDDWELMTKEQWERNVTIGQRFLGVRGGKEVEWLAALARGKSMVVVGCRRARTNAPTNNDVEMVARIWKSFASRSGGKVKIRVIRKEIVRVSERKVGLVEADIRTQQPNMHLWQQTLFFINSDYIFFVFLGYDYSEDKAQKFAMKRLTADMEIEEASFWLRSGRGLRVGLIVMFVLSAATVLVRGVRRRSIW